SDDAHDRIPTTGHRGGLRGLVWCGPVGDCPHRHHLVSRAGDPGSRALPSFHSHRSARAAPGGAGTRTEDSVTSDSLAVGAWIFAPLAPEVEGLCCLEIRGRWWSSSPASVSQSGC